MLATSGRGSSAVVGNAGIGGSGVTVTRGLVPAMQRYGRYSQLDARGMWTPACPVVLSGNRILPGQSSSGGAWQSASWQQPRRLEDSASALGTSLSPTSPLALEQSGSQVCWCCLDV
jgi:hypothetical protein